VTLFYMKRLYNGYRILVPSYTPGQGACALTALFLEKGIERRRGVRYDALPFKCIVPERYIEQGPLRSPQPQLEYLDIPQVFLHMIVKGISV